MIIKSKLHIEIVRSSISELSSMSQVSCDALFCVLTKHYSKVGVSIVNNLADLEALVATKPDLVFVGMEFVPLSQALGANSPAKIWLSEYLDKHGIAYTGSSYLAHALGRDKSLAKLRVLEAGLKTAAFSIIKQDQILSDASPALKYPLFVKPLNRGGGQGIDNNSLVYNFEQLLAKTRSIADNLQADSLIEEYLPGREFSVAILKDELSTDYSLMPLELIAPLSANGARILSGEVKSSDSEQAILITDIALKARVEELAINVFYALGARDYGRIDIRLDEFGEPHFLEANLIPSIISGYGSFPKACVLNAGLSYEPMIIRIVRLGLARAYVTLDDTIEPIILGPSILPAPEVAF